MKHCLFLLSILSTVYIINAGPLRLQKRAAFYIANETACVVDNIVYSNGEPIPTDDPCEACKCRPPGFACVLQECRPKPGCKAVRHAGQCCPEYVCGCEHNGRMYRDGDQIRDEKNPCYECHCQGSSIACAFVDCFFPIDCIPIYVPGECCPHNVNCSRDVPERTPVIGDNALPPANLLPELYDESILPKDSYAPEVKDSTQLPTTENKGEKAPPKPEDTKSVDKPIETQTSKSDIPVIETKSPEIEEKNPGAIDKEVIANEKVKDTDVKDEESSEEKESVEEIKTLFNSETKLKEQDSLEITTTKATTENNSTKESITVSTESEPESKEKIQTADTNKIEIIKSVLEKTTERPIESTSHSSEVIVTEKPVKNSAADNSKSLKLTEKTKEKQGKSTDEVKSVKDEVVETQDQKNETASPVLKEGSSTMESNSTEIEESIAEESINDPKSIAFYTDDQVIKKESAETVTIVVHVREKTRLPTETDFVTTTTNEFLTSSVSEESFYESIEVETLETSKKSTELEETVSTSKNVEIFPIKISTTESKDESTTSSPEPVIKSIEARSEVDSDDSEVEKKVTTEKSSLISGEPFTSVPLTTTVNASEDVVEISKEGRSDDPLMEDANGEPKLPELTDKELKLSEESDKEIKVTEKATQEPKLEEKTTENSNVALKTGTITDIEDAPKIEGINKEPKQEVPDEMQNKPDEIEIPKPEGMETINPDKKSISVQKPEEPKPKERSEETEENIEKVKPEKKVEETNSKENEEPKPEGKLEESKADENVEDSKAKEDIDERKLEENANEQKTEENVEKPKEKADETKLKENVDETKPEEKLAESNFKKNEEQEKKETELKEKTKDSSDTNLKVLEEKQEDKLSEGTKDEEHKESKIPDETKDQEHKESKQSE